MGSLQLSSKPSQSDKIVIQVENSFATYAELSVALFPKTSCFLTQTLHFASFRLVFQQCLCSVDNRVRTGLGDHFLDFALCLSLLSDTQLDVPVEGCLLCIFSPKPIAAHGQGRHVRPGFVHKSIISLDPFFVSDRNTRFLGQ